MSTTNIAKDWLLEKGCMILKINEDQGKKQKGMHDGKSNKQKNLE
jgi:hypothetical protein